MRKTKNADQPYQTELDSIQTNSRREALFYLLRGIGAIAIGAGVGCSVRRQYSDERSIIMPVKMVLVRDLFVLRFTTDPGKPVEVLPGDHIADGIPKSFIWQEKTHSHIYTFDASHYERLKRGETIVVTSDRQQDHTHSFMVDPKVYVESGRAIQVPLREIDNASEFEPITPEDIIKIIG
jgi:hypothetical protein